MNIWYGSNENRRLSNLYYRPFVFQGKEYVTVEHGYQANKSGVLDINNYNAPWKSGSKFIGKFKANTKNNWNILLMKMLIRNSFAQNTDELIYLMSLDDMVFTHNQDRGIWREEFPRILMEVRDNFIKIHS